jgi:hypothetical protein
VLKGEDGYDERPTPFAGATQGYCQVYGATVAGIFRTVPAVPR